LGLPDRRPGRDPHSSAIGKSLARTAPGILSPGAVAFGCPGIKIVAPATTYDAIGLLKSAVRDDDPVLMLEHKLLYGSKGIRAESGGIDASSEIPDEDYIVPIGKGIVRREGKDVTVIRILLMMHYNLQAAVERILT